MSEERSDKATERLDMEWVQLILEAKLLGIAKEEIQTFFEEQKIQINVFE